MLIEPFCFINFLESKDIPIIKYIDNWAEGGVQYYFFEEDLIINMQTCIHIDVAEAYLKKINAMHLRNELANIDCPCYFHK